MSANARGPTPLYTPQATGTKFDPRVFPSAQPYPIIQQYSVVGVNRRPAWLRFLHAFTAAALVWFLCSTFLPGLLSRIHYRPLTGVNDIIPAHVVLDHCVSDGDWSNQAAHHDFPFTASTTFKLPLSAENLLLISRGPRLSHGSVDIVTSPQQDQDAATVEVAVSYLAQDALHEVKACYIRRRDGEIGVGIFTSEESWLGRRKNKLLVEAKVILPELSPESSPLLIKKFETDVVNIVHHVGDLNKKVLFQSLLLKGENAGIDVQSVQADTAYIGTSNGEIIGVFNTTKSLALITKNGRVDADIGLLSFNGTKPNLSVLTTNAAVASRISLSSDKSQGGIFHASVKTSNGQLDVDFPAAPPYSLLTFSGATSNGKAVVSLHPAYEGSFFVQTSNSKPVVNHDETVTDPSGRNRERSLNIKPLKKLIVGDVYWKDETEQGEWKPTGAVSVRSSNADVELNL